MATEFISSISSEDFQKGSEAGRRQLARGPLAVSAQYTDQRIRVELDNGCFFEFPVAQAQGLQGAKSADLRIIEIMASGLGLHWPKLDADLYVPALVKGILGGKRWMADIGRMGGIAQSESKASAARANGAKGGRPRKLVVAS